jgi:hypothetical protein
MNKRSGKTRWRPAPSAGGNDPKSWGAIPLEEKDGRGIAKPAFDPDQWLRDAQAQGQRCHLRRRRRCPRRHLHRECPPRRSTAPTGPATAETVRVQLASQPPRSLNGLSSSYRDQIRNFSSISILLQKKSKLIDCGVRTPRRAVATRRPLVNIALSRNQNDIECRRTSNTSLWSSMISSRTPVRVFHHWFGSKPE